MLGPYFKNEKKKYISVLKPKYSLLLFTYITYNNAFKTVLNDRIISID